MRILDLFSGAGGAARGYHDAGFDVVGVDINPMPRFPYRFVQADAVEVMDTLLGGDNIAGYRIEDFDAVHASPPCQPYSAMSNCRPGLAGDYPKLIKVVRDQLADTGLPYVIENVPGAPLLDPVMLCGTMFGRDLYRHRLFETNFPLTAPDHPEHVMPASKAGHWMPGTVMSVAGHFAPVAHARHIMGIDWMCREEMAEAIPPAYAEYVGRHLLGIAQPVVREMDGVS